MSGIGTCPTAFPNATRRQQKAWLGYMGARARVSARRRQAGDGKQRIKSIGDAVWALKAACCGDNFEHQPLFVPVRSFWLRLQLKLGGPLARSTMYAYLQNLIAAGVCIRRYGQVCYVALAAPDARLEGPARVDESPRRWTTISNRIAKSTKSIQKNGSPDNFSLSMAGQGDGMDNAQPRPSRRGMHNAQGANRINGRFAKAAPPTPPSIPPAAGVRGLVAAAGEAVDNAKLNMAPTRSKIRPIPAKSSFERWQPVRVPALRSPMPLYAHEELSRIAEMEKFAMPGFAAQSPAAGTVTPAEGRAMLDEIWRQEQALMAAEAPPPVQKKPKPPAKAVPTPDPEPWLPDDEKVAERAWLKKNVGSLQGFDALLCRPEAHLKFTRGAWRAAAALLCMRWPKEILHPSTALADLAAGVASGHLLDPRPLDTPRSALSWPDGLRHFANLKAFSGDF